MTNVSNSPRVGAAAMRQRYREIARVLARNGFDRLWSQWRLGAVFGVESGSGETARQGQRSEPERLRTVLEELGTTFIKIGQLLSTRPDLVPSEYLAELSKLQDDAPRVPYADIAGMIEQEFGKRPEDLFGTFDVEPRAAASIAQVHAATLPDGTAVVVKVRRPGIEGRIEQDLAVLGQIARLLAQHPNLRRRYDPVALVDEFAYSIRNELDLVREGQNAERIASQFADDPCLHVPRIFWEFSGTSVLTMEEIRGIKVDDLQALDAAGVDRRVLAKTCAHIALVQVLENGFYHADPHPGNFFVLADGSVALLDYGMVGRVGDRLRESLARLAMAVSHNDAERLADELLSLGAASGPVERTELIRDVGRLLERYDGATLGQISARTILHEVADVAQRHDLRLPSDLVMLARVVAMDEGMGARLDPEFSFAEYGREYFERFWRRTYSWTQAASHLKEGVLDLADLGRELPYRLRRLVSLVERGELTVTSRLDVPEALTLRLQHAANRVAISIVLAGLTVGLSVLTVVYGPAGSDGTVSFALKAILAIALVVGAWLLGSLWKSAH